MLYVVSVLVLQEKLLEETCCVVDAQECSDRTS